MSLHYKTFPFVIKSAQEQDNIGRINGYGSIFGNADSYNERVAKGAFAKSLSSGSKIKMLWQHDAASPIGNWENLKEDEIGLTGDALLPLNIVSVREKYEMAKAGLVEGLSIGYMVRDNGWEKLDDGSYLLKDLDLREISMVTFPANPLALISSVKSLTFTPNQLEYYLLSLGFSPNQAKGAVERSFVDASQFDERKKEEAAIIKSINDLTDAIKRGIKL